MRSRKEKPPKPAPSRFAPTAFLKGSPAAVAELCQELADIAAGRFADLTGTSWLAVGNALAAQLRSAGHDLMSLEEADGLQEWQATWHHPRGTFSLLLVFRAPSQVEVSWKSDTDTIAARAGA